MQIHVSPDDGLPVYKQIFNQVKYLVASGVLLPGEELPPIRALAEQLVINPNTVARAYRELEHAGIVFKRGTAGTYVSDAPSHFARRERLRVLRQRIDALLADARHMLSWGRLATVLAFWLVTFGTLLGSALAFVLEGRISGLTLAACLVLLTPVQGTIAAPLALHLNRVR